MSVIIFRYLCKALYTNTLGISLVLLIILITNQFVHYVNVAATGQITMMTVTQLMGLQVPILLGYLLPMGFYLAILLVLGRLYADSEMTVLFACGMSQARLLGMIMLFAAGVSLCVGLIVLYLEPLAQVARTRILEHALSQATIQKVIPNQFRKIGEDGSAFYVRRVAREKKSMEDVFFVTPAAKAAHQKAAWDITYAKSAKMVSYEDKPGKFLVFESGARTVGAPGGYTFQTAHFQNYGVRLDQRHFVLSDWPLTASTGELWKMHVGNREADALFQWRLALPISVWLFTLIAVPLSRVKPRQGKFAQFLPAILIYIVYADLLFLGRAWIKKGVVSHAMGLWWLHGATLILALGILFYKWGFGWLKQALRRRQHAVA